MPTTVIMCASARLADRCNRTASGLRKLGMNIVMPAFTEGPLDPKIRAALMRKQLEAMKHADVVLVINGDIMSPDRKKIVASRYIGPSVLIEMGWAFALRKRIYLLNPLSPNSTVTEEVAAMEPVVLDGKVVSMNSHLLTNPISPLD